MDPNFITFGINCYLVFLMSTVLHEAAHAYAAMKLGDLTAYYGGQVSLNPMPHIEREPVGMVVIPIICYSIVGSPLGWATAPYDPLWADRHPKRAALMALAGPLANLLLAVIAYIGIMIGMKFGWFTYPERVGGLTGLMQFVSPTKDDPIIFGVATTLSIFFSLNVLLFVFNLLPLPPLDGSSVVKLFMPENVALNYQNAMRDPKNMLVGLIIALMVFNFYIAKYFSVIVLKILYPEMSYA